jgi:hypothetical protein
MYAYICTAVANRSNRRIRFSIGGNVFCVTEVFVRMARVCRFLYIQNVHGSLRIKYIVACPVQIPSFSFIQTLFPHLAVLEASYVQQ